MTEKYFKESLKAFEAEKSKLQAIKLICDRSRELSNKKGSKIQYLGLLEAKKFCDENIYTTGFALKASKFIKNNLIDSSK